MRKALILVPDSLEKVNGFLNGCHALTRVLKSLGFSADVVAHYMGPEGLPKHFRGLYRNVYYPRNNSPLVDQMNSLVQKQHAAMAGRQAPSWSNNYLFPAAVLASLAEYDLYVVHHIVSDWIKHYLPEGSKKLLFAHYFQSIEDGDVNRSPRAEIEANLRAEIEPCWGYDLVAVTGERDRKLFRKYRPGVNVVHLPHCTTISPRPRLRSDASAIVMTGFDNRPNRMALDWFYKKVYPTLHQLKPDVEVHITSAIGEYARTKGYDKRSGTVIHGYVPDIAAVYRQCDMLVAPIFHSEGVKTRIFEALGLGIPVMTTSQGLTNTRMRGGRDVMVADDGTDMARLLARTLESLATRKRLQDNGYAYIRRNHDIDAPTFAPLKKAILGLVAKNARASEANSNPQRAARLAKPVSRGPSSWITENLQRLIPWTVERCQAAGYKRVAFFGAGTHTRTVLPLWNALGGAKVVRILTNLPPEVDRLLGVPVVSTRQFNPATVDAIVVSSHSFEPELVDTCRKRFPRVPLVTIWAPPTASGRRSRSAS